MMNLARAIKNKSSDPHDDNIFFRPYLSDHERMGTTLHTTKESGQTVSSFPGNGVTIIIRKAINLPMKRIWDCVDGLFPPKAKVRAQITRPGRKDIELFTTAVAIVKSDTYAAYPLSSLL